MMCVISIAEEISEILNRHNTLREANADLMQHSAQVTSITFNPPSDN